MTVLTAWDLSVARIERQRELTAAESRGGDLLDQLRLILANHPETAWLQARRLVLEIEAEARL